MRKKVVITQSSVTAEQLEDFFRMIKDGSIGFEELESFLDNPKKFSKVDSDCCEPITMAAAADILGADKVLTAEAVCSVWGVSPPLDSSVCYSEKTILTCAAANKSGKADWRLVYIIGQTLCRQREIVGVDKFQQPCFYNNNDWYLEEAENTWNVQPAEAANYCLINFQPIGANVNYGKQDLEIAKNFSGCERVNPHVFSEAIISLFKLKGERMAANWLHRSAVLRSDGSRISVGDFDDSGLLVRNHHDADLCASLRVVICRKIEN